MTAKLSALGHEIPAHCFGPLNEHTQLLDDSTALQLALEDDGYLLLRDVLPVDEVLAARKAIFEKLIGVGEINEPALEGMPTGTSQREAMHKDLGAFWQDVCETESLRSLSHGTTMHALMEKVLGAPVRPFDFLWLRTMLPGKASAFHYDHVYMNRGSEDLLTCWTPLGEAPMVDGPMLLVEGSHKFSDLIEEYKGFDVDKDQSRPGHVTMNPVALAEERDCRLLSRILKQVIYSS